MLYHMLVGLAIDSSIFINATTISFVAKASSLHRTDFSMKWALSSHSMRKLDQLTTHPSSISLRSSCQILNACIVKSLDIYLSTLYIIFSKCASFNSRNVTLKTHVCYSGP
jgi:hypothetical protein